MVRLRRIRAKRGRPSKTRPDTRERTNDYSAFRKLTRSAFSSGVKPIEKRVS